jgi:hypothetical protein
MGRSWTPRDWLLSIDAQTRATQRVASAGFETGLVLACLMHGSGLVPRPGACWGWSERSYLRRGDCGAVLVFPLNPAARLGIGFVRSPSSETRHLTAAAS